MGRGIAAVMALLLGAVLVVGAAGSWWEARGHAHPPRHPVGAPPAGFPGPLEDVSFDTAGGITLQGWYGPAPDGRTAVVLLHPFGGNRTSMASRAALYRQAGFGVLLYDARACGNSGGRTSTVGYRETADLLAALQWLREHGVRDIVCHGWSQGGSTIMQAAPLLGDVRGVVLEAAFDTMEHAIDRAARRRVRLPGSVSALLYTPLFERMTGMRVADFRPIDHAGELRCPVFIVAGTSDRSTWEADTLDIARAVRAEKQVWLIPGAEHEDLYAFAPAEYRSRILGFVTDCLEPGP